MVSLCNVATHGLAGACSCNNLALHIQVALEPAHEVLRHAAARIMLT
jgi:hypothetical protein